MATVGTKEKELGNEAGLTIVDDSGRSSAELKKRKCQKERLKNKQTTAKSKLQTKEITRLKKEVKILQLETQSQSNAMVSLQAQLNQQQEQIGH